MSLDQKHALITGSSRGIGRGIALKLAAQGARIAVHYYRNEAAAKETLAAIRGRGSDGFVMQADVCHPDEVNEFCTFDNLTAPKGRLPINTVTCPDTMGPPTWGTGPSVSGQSCMSEMRAAGCGMALSSTVTVTISSGCRPWPHRSPG